MENTVYYTFSTISQSLAAMIALLGVFTIYMLQTLNSRIIDISLGYLEYLNKLEKDKNPNTGIWFVNRELNGLIISKNLKKIKAIADREHQKWGDFSTELKLFNESLHEFIQIKNSIILKTIKITTISFITILASIFMLSISIYVSRLFFWLTFPIFIIAISYIFLSAFRLIKVSVSSDI